MTESEVITSTPVEPTDPGYIGCYANMTNDRVMATVLTMADFATKVKICGGFGVESFTSGIWLAGPFVAFSL